MLERLEQIAAHVHAVLVQDFLKLWFAQHPKLSLAARERVALTAFAAESFKQRAPGLFGIDCKLVHEPDAAVVLRERRVQAFWLDAARTDGDARCCDLIAHQMMVCFHERRRPRDSGQWHALEAGTAQIVARLAQPVDKRLDIPWQFYSSHSCSPFPCLVSCVAFGSPVSKISSP